MSRLRRLSPGIKTLIIVLATVVLYVVTARLGLKLALPPEKKATAVWLPSGIALAAILIGGYRLWPGIWLGAFIANAWDFFDPASKFSLGAHLAVSSGIATGSTLQPLLGAFLMHRWIGRENLLESARSVFQFIGITLLLCLTASTVGVTTLMVTGFAPWSKYAFAWWTWWVGDTIGILIVTPLILSWIKPTWFKWDLRRLGEAACLLGLLLGVTLFVFGGWSPWGIVASTLAYLTVPLLVWAAFRFGQHGATASLLLVSKVAVWGTAHGYGPFVQQTLNESLLLLQTFVGVLAVTTLALAGVLAERRRAEQAKLGAIQQLEHALHEIKTLRGLIPICAWCKKIRNDAGSWEQLEAYLRHHTEAQFSHGICPECLKKRQGPFPHPEGDAAAP
jgi:integral membrane sensor domain MASE1